MRDYKEFDGHLENISNERSEIEFSRVAALSCLSEIE